MRNVRLWIFVIIGLLYFSAIRVDTMDIDASQYAEMSREMAKSGDYLHLYDRGMDYLDKPPFLFWASATGIRIFGVNNFGYKLPSILFALWCLYATYRLARRLYGETIGRYAALILATCQGMFLMTNDIRCDTILMSWVVTAIWMLQEWVVNRKIKHLIAGAACIAFGMMTKGPIALMVPVFCFIANWSLHREWANFLKPQYLLALLVIGVLLIPMSIGLYQQFDLHPEKVMAGKTGVSGLRFFYWSQSFGRITGESPWKNGADMSFLLLNMLWSFLPWILLFLAALIYNTATLIKQKFRLQPQQEWITTGGFLLSYLSLGSSAYQLPHYIFVAFPLAAIVTAKFIYDITENGELPKLKKLMQPVHYVITLILLVVTLILVTYVFPAPVFVMVLAVLGIVFILALIFTKQPVNKLLLVPAMGIIIVNIFVSNQLYPNLLKFQVGSTVGKYMRQQGVTGKDAVGYKMHDPMNSISFYANDLINCTDTVRDVAGKKYVLTMDDGALDLKQKGYQFDTVFSGQLFKISELTLPFLDPATRSTETRAYYWLKIR